MAGIPDDAVDAFYVDVGRRIRDARLAKNVTQAHLAAHASMTRSSIANLEAGRQKIPLHILALIADALSVDPASLLPPISVAAEFEVSSVVDEKLAEAPRSTRDFVQGAIAGLRSPAPRED